MMSRVLPPLLFLLTAFSMLAAPPAAADAGRKEVLRTCQRCHSLETVAAQHLSREEWGDELRKMAAMGARIRNRDAVLDFLAQKYGELPTRDACIRPATVKGSCYP